MRKRHVSLRVVCRAGRRGRWSYSLAVTCNKSVHDRVTQSCRERTTLSTTAAKPSQLQTHRTNWIPFFGLWNCVFDSWALGTPVFLLCDLCLIFIFIFPSFPFFFFLGLLFGCRSLFDCLFFPSSPFQAIHSFSSSRGFAKSVVVFYIELVKSSCSVWSREVVARSLSFVWNCEVVRVFVWGFWD
jgi:hypothetical protein